VSGSSFWLDASACSGCKACQVACKDRHDLPVGVRWRRVYEVVGGGWTRRDGAWLHDVFAYNLSVACNHCERPVCLEACPTGAITRRPDGIVLLDGDRCVGCRYCAWVCPYGAPQFDAASGRMSKCSFCVDDLERGDAPACVTACPQRALDFGDPEELAARHTAGATVHPLPDPSLTAPAWLLEPHPGAAGAETCGARVANREEVGPAEVGWAGEGALVAFTLLAQAAAGMSWALAAASWAFGRGAWGGSPMETEAALCVPWLAVGTLALVAAAASVLHLGSPGNAWRVLAAARRSWLSREVLLLLIFVAVWAVMVPLLPWGSGPGPGSGPGAGPEATRHHGLAGALALAVAAAGLGLVYTMARVYCVRTVPAWDTYLTPAAFFLTAGSLGGLGAALAVGLAGGPARIVAIFSLAAGTCLAAELALEPAWRVLRRRAATRVDPGLHPRGAKAPPVGALRPVLLLAALASSAAAGMVGTGRMGPSVVAMLVALLVAMAAAVVAAILGRAAFYASHARVGL
jgi:anaerobic dimethyl sulfoxide reductase subunit B (iron-sulfur subunit)